MADLWRQHTLDIYGVEVFAVSTRSGWDDLRKTMTFISKKPGAAGLTSWSVWHPKRGKVKGTPHGHLVLWVDVARIHSSTELVEICAHEAHHGAQRIHEWTGVEDQEAAAHLAGWLTGWLHESITERGAE